MWAWLIGPFVDAWLKVHPEDRTAAGSSWKDSISTWMKALLAASVKSSTPKRLIVNGDASRRPGVSQKCCDASSRRQIEQRQLRLLQPMLGLIVVRFLS